MKHPQVMALIAAGQAKSAQKMNITKELILGHLLKVVENGKDGDRVQAARQISKMLGFDAPTEISHNVTAMTSEERERRIRALLAEHPDLVKP